jgi:hypothetical protein
MRNSLHQALSENHFVPEFWDKTAEQIYEDVAFRNVIGNDRRLQTSGVAYARKSLLSAMEAKDAARNRILASLTRKERRGGLRILTMPGLEWKFEKELISRRDYAGRHAAKRVRDEWQTKIYAVEYDPAIFFGSMKWIPGRRKGLTQLSPHAIKTCVVRCYYMTDVESFIRDPQCPEFDAAWLDFTGYMTPRLLSSIRHFWRERCAWQLTVTGLNARYPSSVKEQVKRHGGMCEWIAETLGGKVFDKYGYFDEYSAMYQVTVRK